MPEQDATRPVPYSDSHLSVEGTEKFYHLDNDALEFFKTASGIKDEEGLRMHIIAVQREAYKVNCLCHPPLSCLLIAWQSSMRIHA